LNSAELSDSREAEEKRRCFSMIIPTEKTESRGEANDHRASEMLKFLPKLASAAGQRALDAFPSVVARLNATTRGIFGGAVIVSLALLSVFSVGMIIRKAPPLLFSLA